MASRTMLFTAGANYSDTKIAVALKDFLIAKDIFNSHELHDVSNLVRPIAFYGLVSLHGCKLQGKGRPQAILALRLGAEGTLEMGCAASPAFRPDIFINLNVFSTTLPREATTGRLNRGLPPSDPNTSIEVNGDGLLQYLE